MSEALSLRATLEAPPPTGLGAARAPGHRPCPRFLLDATAAAELPHRLAAADWTLLGLWGDENAVHAALHDEGAAELAVVTLPCTGGGFPSLGAVRPGAIRLERTIHDLWGHVPVGSVDGRPWLDHGTWDAAHPMADRPMPRRPARDGSQYPFLAAEGDGLHQIPVGPVHAGIIEPGHFRFHANGETVVRLEERLGYVHKGTLQLMRGKPPAAAARLAARLSGDSTVASSLAFARAVEAALGIEAPPRAQHLRGVMAELERIANHLGDIGAICNDASFAFMLAHMSVLRENVLRAAEALFGHRLMMDRIVPGGVAVDLEPGGATRLAELCRATERRLLELERVYRDRPSLLDRTQSTGIVAPELARRFAAGGYVGRASGRGIDMRRNPGYAPYDALDFEVPVLIEGDVHSRVLVRFAEVKASLGLVRELAARLPEGALAAGLPAGRGEGIALVEAFRGDLLASVTLDGDGRVANAFLRDASWFQWPLLEQAIEGNIVADFPLCNKSFNCSYSGHDV